MKTLTSQKRQIFQRARLARDARFDGVFFVAVKTTKIYCRVICPVRLPLEKNVTYFINQASAAYAGYRPCLRCRPDAAPHSWAWKGVETTFLRAMSLIDQGELGHLSIKQFCQRLGISDRYLRKLFSRYLGVSPKQYASYRASLFAKQLLHQTSLPIGQVAIGSGFNSVRRFNTVFKKHIGLTPSQVRKNNKDSTAQALRLKPLSLTLSYRPPYHWAHLLAFLKFRAVAGLESVKGGVYSRTVSTDNSCGFFRISQDEAKHCLHLQVSLSDMSDLYQVVEKVKLIFDVAAPIAQIDKQLKTQLGVEFNYQQGLRIPGIWSQFEAGVRAILGQQVSVKQAHILLAKVVSELGEKVEFDGQLCYLFPTAKVLSQSELAFLKMPAARKQCLRDLATAQLNGELNDINRWSLIKGIGPWTVNYVLLRAMKHPDVWLANDAGIKNALKMMGEGFDSKQCSPWRSYLTFQLWNQL